MQVTSKGNHKGKATGGNVRQRGATPRKELVRETIKARQREATRSNVRQWEATLKKAQPEMASPKKKAQR